MDIDDLCHACQFGNHEKVENILAKGQVDVNGRNTCGSITPLITAMLYNQPRIVQTLLDNVNTKLDLCDENGMTGLHHGCFIHWEECVKLFTSDCRCTPEVLNMKDMYGVTAMMAAIYTSDMLECVKILGELPGTDMGIKDNNGWTALEVAEFYDRKEIVKYLNHKEKCKQTVAKFDSLKLSEIDDKNTKEEDKPKGRKHKREKICWNCIAHPSSSKKLYRCCGCMAAWYCNEQCQGEDRDRHEEWCHRKERIRREKQCHE